MVKQILSLLVVLAGSLSTPASASISEEDPQQRRLRGLSLVDPKSIMSKSTAPWSYIASDAQEQCCVPCTTPADTCCLECNDVSSFREHDLLMASMEGLTHHLSEKHAGAHSFLDTRVWQGNGNIGNRPLQSTFYYDWVRSALGGEVRHVCEIGLNGGHSAVIFLASLAGREGVHLTMFDLLGWDYSSSAVQYVENLYPGKMNMIAGNSRRMVPDFTSKNQHDLCDVFSVDGGHRYFETHADILNALKATKKGGILILDDMNPGSNTRRAFDDVVNEGGMTNVHCVEDVMQRVGYDNRVDETNAREMLLSWCMATVV